MNLYQALKEAENRNLYNLFTEALNIINYNVNNYKFFDINYLIEELKKRNINTTKRDIEIILNIMLCDIGNIVRHDYYKRDAIYEILDDRLKDSRYSKSFYEFIDDFPNEDKKLLLISDTHIGNPIYENFGLLNKIYDYAIKNGVNYAFHLGDILEGRKNATVNEMLEVSKKQVESLINNYPNPTKEELKTIALIGNHDQYIHGRVGIDLLMEPTPEYYDLRMINRYLSSFNLYSRNSFRTEISNIPIHFSHKLYLNKITRDKKINTLDEIDEDVKQLSRDYPIYFSGHLHTGLLYINSDRYDNDQFIVGVPSTSLINKNNVVAYIIEIQSKTKNITVRPLYGDSNNNISEKEEYEYKCNEKNKVLKKEFNKI